jgi:hypothetical protein
MQGIVSLFTALLILRGLSVQAADEHKTFTVGAFSFSKPEKWTWVDIQPGMRAAQLEIKGEDGKTGEVVFFNFPGGGGGVQANIDRWLGMFQEGKDKINARTEKVTKEKGTITYVQAEGTYLSGMPGGPKTPQPGYMLQGAIIESPAANVFIRLTGPIALVKSSQAEFRKMAESAVK